MQDTGMFSPVGYIRAACAGLPARGQGSHLCPQLPVCEAVKQSTRPCVVCRRPTFLADPLRKI